MLPETAFRMQNFQIKTRKKCFLRIPDTIVARARLLVAPVTLLACLKVPKNPTYSRFFKLTAAISAEKCNLTRQKIATFQFASFLVKSKLKSG